MNRKPCLRCQARRPVLWIVPEFVWMVLCPFCDNVQISGTGFEVSMSVTAWTDFLENSIFASRIQDDDPPPPGPPRNPFDRWIDRQMKDR